MLFNYKCWSLAVLVLLESVAYVASAEETQSWSFPNWNSYSQDDPAPNALWLRAWGVPKKHGWSWPSPSSGKKNYDIVKDPEQTQDSDLNLVLRVVYPEGSRNPQNEPQGGIGFYAQPLEIDNTIESVSFEYQVYFSKKFNFMKGGKLPGIFGGSGKCSGGTNSLTCFSSRFMWRRGGLGEVYAYMPESEQSPDLCKDPTNICDPRYGYSLGRGTWKFKTGEWMTVRQSIKLNTPGELDGNLVVYVNGEQVLEEDSIAFREDTTEQSIGIVFQTFFGGSDESWESPRTQYSYFKGFILEATL
ncbi:hypothetical protein BDF14DRAFT_1982863 [Spinellus fusiger]|nr:hypothetical protein BDF14DRAFT_1982863 [Spinellus fusiger]